MSKKEKAIIAIYLNIRDCIFDANDFLLYKEIFLLEKKVSVITINEQYYIGNASRWKANMKIMIQKLEQCECNEICREIYTLLENVEK